MENTYLNTLSFPGYADNLNKTYLDFLTTYKPEMDGFFITRNVGENAETTVRLDEQDMSQYANDKPEGNDATRLSFGTGYFKNIEAYRIGAQLNISYEMRVAKRFDLGMAIKRFNSSVVDRMELDRQHRLTFANASSYVNMNGRTVDVTCGDGLPMASAVHPLAFTTTTWSNIAPTATLTPTALDSMEELFVTDILDNYGLPVQMNATHLIVQRQSPATVRAAMEILRSSTLVTQANPGVVNAYQAKYKLMELTKVATDAMGRIDGTKAGWYMLASLEGANRLQAFEYVWESPTSNVTPMNGNNGVDAYNDDYTFGRRARYAHGCVSARGIVFNFA